MYIKIGYTHLIHIDVKYSYPVVLHDVHPEPPALYTFHLYPPQPCCRAQYIKIVTSHRQTERKAAPKQSADKPDSDGVLGDPLQGWGCLINTRPVPVTFCE